STEVPRSLIAWRGACLSIPCRYKPCLLFTRSSSKPTIEYLAWYLNPVFDPEKKEFTGTVLYKHNASIDPAFHGRVRFLGDLQRDCSLQVSDLQANETGKYGLRLIVSHPRKKQKIKWLSEISVNVMDSPPAPQIQAPNDFRESIPARVVCLIGYHCPDYPINLTWVGLDHGTPEYATRSADGSGLTNNTLSFTPTWQDHGANLTCQLSTLDGIQHSESTVVLDVKFAPRNVLLNVTPNQTIEEGVRLMLSCMSQDSNPPVSKYQLYKDGQLLQEGQTLEFEAKGDEHTGSYHCEASNEIYTVSSPKLRIDIQYAPKDARVELMTDSQIEEGTTVVLRCSCKAQPSASNYTWYRNRQRVLAQTQEELRFDEIRPDQFGSYYCEPQNSIGESKSPAIMVDIQYGPKDVRLTLENPQRILEGDLVTLNCSVGSSNPPVTKYTWYKDDTQYKETLENILTFPATEEQSGDYSCEAENDLCSFAPFNLGSFYSPDAPKDAHVELVPDSWIEEGTTVVLRCSCRAQPSASSYTWYRNGQRMQAQTQEELRFNEIHPDQSGSYQCEPQNSIGESESPAVMIDVQIILNAPQRILEGDLVMLNCSVGNSNPPVTKYTWYKDDRQYKETRENTLTFPATDEQTGDYSCRAENMVSFRQSLSLSVNVLCKYYRRNHFVLLPQNFYSIGAFQRETKIRFSPIRKMICLS
uniref:B-cell receptor CD22 n=1 Tax=Pelusios castaneus TaxID=367368 RepID=A0A8C8VGK3_9SAUR